MQIKVSIAIVVSQYCGSEVFATVDYCVIPLIVCAFDELMALWKPLGVVYRL